MNPTQNAHAQMILKRTIDESAKKKNANHESPL